MQLHPWMLLVSGSGAFLMASVLYLSLTVISPNFESEFAILAVPSLLTLAILLGPEWEFIVGLMNSIRNVLYLSSDANFSCVYEVSGSAEPILRAFCFHLNVISIFCYIGFLAVVYLDKVEKRKASVITKVV